MSRRTHRNSAPAAEQPTAATGADSKLSAERASWRRQLRAAWWLNGITAAGTLIALVGLFFVYLSFKEAERAGDIAHSSLIASNRGWLSPVDAVLDAPLKQGQPINVLIVFENTGKSPVMDIYNVAGGGITMPFSAEEARQQQKSGPFGGSAVDACKGISAHLGYPVIFPSATRQLEATVPQTFVADDAVLAGNRTFFIHGCAAYTTMSEPHLTEYCFWLGPRIDTNGFRKFQPCLGSFHAN